MKMSRFHMWGKKRQDNPQGNKQSENLLQSSQNYCFLLKNFA